MSHRSVDPRLMNRLSVKKVGVGLVGLAGWGEGANVKIPFAPSAKKLVVAASQNLGCVRLNIDNESIVGSKIRVTGKKTWGEKLDLLSSHLQEDKPVYFALFRSARDCLIVTYNPEGADRFEKMLYASSKDGLKDALLDIDAEMSLEEFNVTEAVELTYANYQRKVDAPPPLTEHEILRQEHDTAETAGNYGILARLKALERGETDNRDVMSGDSGAKPIALPGLVGLKNGLAAVKLRSRRAEPNPPQEVQRDTQPQKRLRPVQGIQVLPPIVPRNKPESNAAEETKKDTQDEITPPVVPETENVEENEDAPKLVEDDLAVLAPTEQAHISNADTGESSIIIIKRAIGETEEDDVETDDDNNEEVASVVEEIAGEVPTTVYEEPGFLDDDEEKLVDVEIPTSASKPPPSSPLEGEEGSFSAAEATGQMQKLGRQERSQSAIIASASRLGRKLGKVRQHGSTRFVNGIKRIFGGRKGSVEKVMKQGLSPEVLEALDDSDGKLTFDDLKKMKEAGDFGDFDPNQLETYLSQREFAEVFQMTKETFYRLKRWEQDKIKRKVGLF